MISSDRKMFEKGSAVRRRMIEYGSLADELHAIVFSKKSDKLKVQKISDNTWIYPANSLNRWLYVPDAIRIGKKLVSGPHTPNSNPWLITAQDPFEAGLAGASIARGSRAKLQIQIHTDFLSPYFVKESVLNKIRVLIAKFILPKADCIRAVSERIKESLSNVKRQTSNVSTLPIFVDAETIKNFQPKFSLKEKYPQFEKIILIASRLSKEKNISLAIKAMSDIVKKSPKTGLIIVGSGPEEKRLKLKVKNCKLTDNVIFEGWRDDLISYYKTADLFLNTSNYEGYGLTLAESALSGCPIVTTDVGIVLELKKAGVPISICPVGDKNCLIESITGSTPRNESLKPLWQPPQGFFEPNKSEYLKKYRESWQKCLNLVK